MSVAKELINAQITAASGAIEYTAGTGLVTFFEHQFNVFHQFFLRLPSYKIVRKKPLESNVYEKISLR